MGNVNIIVIGLMAYDVILTIVCAKLFSTVSENKFKSEIDRIKIEYLEKKCNINTESVNLLLKSLKDLYGIVKKIVAEDEDGADAEPDVNALVAGWKADEQEEQKVIYC